MQDGQGHVHIDTGERAIRKVLEEPAALARHHHHGQRVVRCPSVPLGNVGNVTRVVQPRALARNTHKHEVIREADKALKHVGGGAQGNVVLGRGAAEQDGNAEVLAHWCSFRRQRARRCPRKLSCAINPIRDPRTCPLAICRRRGDARKG